jgi:hypothetical protein
MVSLNVNSHVNRSADRLVIECKEIEEITAPIEDWQIAGRVITLEEGHTKEEADPSDEMDPRHTLAGETAPHSTDLLELDQGRRWALRSRPS